MDRYELLVGGLAGFASVLTIISITISLGILTIYYYLYCVPQEKIAAKLGHTDRWKSYVPFARNIQRMRMTGMPMWKLFFVGGTFTIVFDCFIMIGITALCMMLHTGFGAAVGIALYLAWVVLYLMSTFQFNHIIADKFGFEKTPMALIWMIIPVIGQVITYIIALSDRFYVGAPNVSASSSTTSEAIATPAVSSAKDDSEIGLACVSGMYSGAKFTMRPTDEFTIGRDSALSNIIVSAGGDKVSRRHCTIKYIPASCSYEVTDFSSNGTFYGNTRLLKGTPTIISRGTTLIIGDKLNQFKLL